jgi:hypothetical protein
MYISPCLAAAPAAVVSVRPASGVRVPALFL